MRSIARFRLLSAISLTVLPAAPADAAKKVRAAAVQLVLDGAPVAEPPDDNDRYQLYQKVVPVLRDNGFAILPSVDPDELVGGAALLAAELAELHVDLRPPSFRFNVVLLPPRWSKTKVGEIKLVDAHNGDKLWSKAVKVPLETRGDAARRQAGVEVALKMLARLQPRADLRGRRDPKLKELLALNDIDADEDAFYESARTLIAGHAGGDPTALVALAATPRLARHPELRVELLREAVVGGGDELGPALGDALVRVVLSGRDDPELVDLLVEGMGLLGVIPGDAFVGRLDELTLDTALDVRHRFPPRQHQRPVDRRIAALAVAAVAASSSFTEAETLIRRLPLEAIPHAAKVELRDELYSRLTPDDASAMYARLIELFPEEEYPPPAEDHLDTAWLADATAIADGGEAERLRLYDDYLKKVPRAAASDRVAAVLGIASQLEARLVERLHGARSPAAEKAAYHSVYGPHPGPVARAALGRALVATLDPHMSDAELRLLIARYPDLDEVAALELGQGLARTPPQHTLPIALGDSAADVRRRFGKPSKVRRELTRRDLSPAAVMAAKVAVPGSRDQGFEVFEYRGRARVLLKDDRVFRIVIEDSRGRFHHGIRTADGPDAIIAALGRPSDTRDLMFRRRLLVWDDAEHGARITVVVDNGRTVFFFEEDPEVADSALSAVW